MKPIYKGLENPMEFELSNCKRPEVYGHLVDFICPKCDTSFETVDLSHGENLEYGSFWSPDACYECGQEFEPIEWEVTATITIKEK